MAEETRSIICALFRIMFITRLQWTKMWGYKPLSENQKGVRTPFNIYIYTTRTDKFRIVERYKNYVYKALNM